MLIITHFNPDIDAICAVWLSKKFGLQEYKNARVDFVPAGQTFEGKPVDSDKQIVHVDTGLGKFDHHQFKDDSICASSLVLDSIKKQLGSQDWEILERLVNIVCEMDHFKECLWPQADDDRYQFLLPDILNGLKIDNELDDQGLVDFGSVCLTGIFQSIRSKLSAEEELAKGIKIQTIWGKTLFVDSGNPETLHLGQKMGYNVVVRNDSKTGLLKIGARPDLTLNLEKIFLMLKKKEPDVNWFFHSSGRLILNGSSKNPKMVPSQLSQTELIKIIKNIN